MTAPADADDELTELTDANFDRVDLVNRPANGIPRFLIAKQDGAAGLLEPDFVRDLIAKAEPGGGSKERVIMPSGVTLTGSPADIAAFIHKASRQQAEPDGVTKAEQSTATQNDLPDSAFAFIEPGGKKDESGKTTPRSLRHFPINDAAHVRNALARASQSPFGDKALPKIRAAAKKFGIEVSKEAGVAGDTITKDMGPDMDEGIDGLDPTVPLAEPDMDAPGDPMDPGSPAWEAIDAATACKWTSILARAGVAIGLLAEREMLEAASADPDDAENAWDLQDVGCAIDYAISVLAPFAVAEQSEADCGTDAMAMIGKAMAGFDGVPLDRIEALALVQKAGRVLSSANEAEIRTAAASLQKVLTSLPAAPMADDQSGQPVTKEAAVAAETPVPEAAVTPSPDAVTELGVTPPAAVAKQDEAAQVAKAGDDDADGPAEMTPQVAVYNCGGELVGFCDPSSLMPVQGGGNADAGSADDADDSGGNVPDPAPDMTPDPDDMDPGPSADAGVPADGVAKEATEAAPDNTNVTMTREVLKSIAADAAREALEAQGAAHQEVIAKMAADKAGLAEELEVLKGRLETVEEQPAMPKVFTNGAVPPAHQLRGQDVSRQGGAPVDVAKAAELKHTLYRGTAAEQNDAHAQMQQMAIDRLAGIHAGPRG